MPSLRNKSLSREKKALIEFDGRLSYSVLYLLASLDCNPALVDSKGPELFIKIRTTIVIRHSVASSGCLTTLKFIRYTQPTPISFTYTYRFMMVRVVIHNIN